ncbi:MAG TPA: hypothetical protein VMR62_25800 [Bryobacteraceae bacterium]|jgi:hypothetical protein|nr:hypothetical protein [Bryobacteraceae bacterium]
MPGSWNDADFPDLTADNHTITSPATRRYNCIAWAAGETNRKWWPDQRNIGWWPKGVQRAETMEAFVEAYGTLGFRLCFDGPSLQPGIEKLALCGMRAAEGEPPIPTHAALQLESGKWTSKLGDFEDIAHDPVEALNGPVYGKVLYYLSRPRS